MKGGRSTGGRGGGPKGSATAGGRQVAKTIIRGATSKTVRDSVAPSAFSGNDDGNNTKPTFSLWGGSDSGSGIISTADADGKSGKTRPTQEQGGGIEHGEGAPVAVHAASENDVAAEEKKEGEGAVATATGAKAQRADAARARRLALLKKEEEARAKAMAAETQQTAMALKGQNERDKEEQKKKAHAAKAERLKIAQQAKEKREERIRAQHATKATAAATAESKVGAVALQVPEPTPASAAALVARTPVNLAAPAKMAPCVNIADFPLGEYECMKKSQIRAGWELDSAKLGVLLVGDEVAVIGARQIEGGTVRCQLQGDMGWVSLATASGAIILDGPLVE